MSTKHAKTKRDLFNFDDLIENTVSTTTHKTKKKKERIPFYIKALNGTNLNTEATENTVTVNSERKITTDDSSIYGNDVRLPEDSQVVQPKQPPEGSYASIWKKPRIRPNVEFEDETAPDEEFDFDMEELDCAIDVQSIEINKLITSHAYHIQPKTQPSSTQGEYQEEPVEDTPVDEKTYDPEPIDKYVEVFDDLHDTTCESKKDLPLGKVKNTAVWPMPSNLEESITLHKNINDLYGTKEERIADKPINEV